LSQGASLPASGYPSPIDFSREDSVPPSGGPPGSDAGYLAAHYLEPANVEYAIMTGTYYDVSTLLDPDFAHAVARAYNDYMVNDWLPKHPSFRGTIVVASQDADLAAREI